MSEENGSVILNCQETKDKIPIVESRTGLELLTALTASFWKSSDRKHEFRLKASFQTDKIHMDLKRKR